MRRIARLMAALGGGAPKISLPQNLITNPGTLIYDFETTTNWTANNGSIGLDAVNVKTGTKSLAITGSVGGLGRATLASISWDISSGGTDAIRLWVYIDDVAKVQAGSPQIVLSKTPFTVSFNNYHYFHAGWNLLNYRAADWTVTGGETWADLVTALRLVFTSVAGQAAVFSYDSLYCGMQTTPALMITFDDSDPTVYTEAYAYMKQHSVSGTFYVITSHIGTGSYATWAQLQEMAASGWAICNHTKTGSALTGLSQAEVQAEIDDAVTTLTTNGLSANALHLAYPGGAYDATVLAGAAASGVLTGRTIDIARYPVLPFDKPQVIELGKQFGNTLSLAQAETWLDNTYARGEVGIALFHKLVAGAPANLTEWKISDFQAFIDYVVSKGIAVITMPQAYALQSGAVSVPKTR